MYLVGVLHDEVLALFQFHALVDDAPEDAPRVVHVQVDLVGKLLGLELLRAQDGVFGRVTHVHARHIPTMEKGNDANYNKQEWAPILFKLRK